MLYDTRWDAKTEADPLSLEALIAWLEKQPAMRPYQYYPCTKCALGQYFDAAGTSYLTQVQSDRGFDIIVEWNDQITHPRPWTFGAALDRARALAAVR